MFVFRRSLKRNSDENKVEEAKTVNINYVIFYIRRTVSFAETWIHQLYWSQVHQHHRRLRLLMFKIRNIIELLPTGEWTKEKNEMKIQMNSTSFIRRNESENFWLTFPLNAANCDELKKYVVSIITVSNLTIKKNISQNRFNSETITSISVIGTYFPIVQPFGMFWKNSQNLSRKCQQKRSLFDNSIIYSLWKPPANIAWSKYTYFSWWNLKLIAAGRIL